MKYMFFDDYSEGAHPEILKAIADANEGQQRGYGLDEYCKLATKRIRAQVGANVDVHYVAGGTAANKLALDVMMRPHEGVIAPTSAHISTHEAGAVEATGHKIIAVESVDGKLTPEAVRAGILTHEDEHTVKPRVVCITQTTESGTVYTRAELKAVIDAAKANGLLVYLDGARLAMAIASPVAAMSLSDLVELGVDMFYIGGTKAGGLLGEALVVVNDDLKTDFRYHVKRHGLLLAKQRMYGAQFARFFDDDNLWVEMGRISNERAMRLATGLESVGVKLAAEPVSNQIFPWLANDVVTELQKEYGFYVWIPGTDPSMVRFVCSWATPESAIDELVKDLAAVIG